MCCCLWLPVELLSASHDEVGVCQEGGWRKVLLVVNLQPAQKAASFSDSVVKNVLLLASYNGHQVQFDYRRLA
jgi:hypothetical protein